MSSRVTTKDPKRVTVTKGPTKSSSQRVTARVYWSESARRIHYKQYTKSHKESTISSPRGSYSGVLVLLGAFVN
jgi:hypothetical protein